MENELIWLLVCYALVGAAILSVVVYFLILTQFNMVISGILDDLLPFFWERNAEIQEYAPK